MVIECPDAGLIPDIPQLDQPVRGARDQLHPRREKVDSQHGVGVAFECLLISPCPVLEFDQGHNVSRQTTYLETAEIVQTP